MTDVIDSGDVARLSLVKIDVEGYDDRILQGVEPLLSSGAALPAILLEVHAHLNPAVREPVAAFCRRNGMAPHLIGDDEGSIVASHSRGRSHGLSRLTGSSRRTLIISSCC